MIYSFCITGQPVKTLKLFTDIELLKQHVLSAAKDPKYWWSSGVGNYFFEHMNLFSIHVHDLNLPYSDKTNKNRLSKEEVKKLLSL